MTSSASTPSTMRRASRRPDGGVDGSIWRTRSSGMGGRWDLYWGYQSSREGFALGVEDHRLVVRLVIRFPGGVAMA